MSNKSKREKKYNGLTFNYKIGDKTMIDVYKDIEEFLKTSFPKNSNPMSPKYDTEIFNVNYNHQMVCWNTGSNIKNVKELINALSEKNRVLFIPFTKIRKDTQKNVLIRKGTYSIERIKEITKDVLFTKDNDEAQIKLDGDVIKGNSDRYKTFFTKGIKCVICGIEGDFFAKEKFPFDKSYHLNLYAINENGEEVLMTKDHILPRSKGGKNHISNYQTMCMICNNLKGDSI